MLKLGEFMGSRIKISFKDRVGFVFDISRVIFDRRINILTIDIQTESLYLHLEKMNSKDLAGVVNELKNVPGVIDLERIFMMPAEEKEMKMKGVFDAVSEGILAVDVDGRITAINPVAQQILRLGSTDMVGKDLARVLSPELPIFLCLTEGKHFNNTEVSLNTAKGRLNFLITGRTLKDEQGNITGAVASIKDMSEVKQLVYTVTKPSMTTFDEILGSSSSIRQAVSLAKMVAKGDSTVLIRGESGTGKELFARAIHMDSPRQNKPFVPINCAAMPDNLLESELFGYVEGAFTGAKRGGKVGLLEFANNGTLFLDEIGEMSTHLQAKLLRVLQEGRVRRIGDRVENPVNVRIIAATNRNLEEMIQTGFFREDLYYRLNVVPINIPPLRQRKDDIPLIARFFITKLNRRLEKDVHSVNEQAMKKLLVYHWPGNVRELENILERAMVLVQGDEIQSEHIVMDRYYENPAEMPYLLQIPSEGEPEPVMDGGLTLEEAVDRFERGLITRAMEKYGSIRSTAKALGVSHTTIMNKLKKYK